MKTYHNEADTSGITKIASKIFWSFSNKVVRFRKIAILQPSFIKVEIFLEQKEVAFLSPSKICENLNLKGAQ